MYYFLINKPYGMLSQFTREADHHQVLGDLYNFPKTVYPIGRLDRDSEGLLILTDDKHLHTRLLHPKWQHHRSYWAQVEGVPDHEALQKLRTGVQIRAKKKQWTTLPASVQLLTEAPIKTARNPPVRSRLSVADSWLKLTLTEGKNRQVRRMCAAVGFPVLRLVRCSIEQLNIEQLGDKTVKSLPQSTIYKALKIKT